MKVLIDQNISFRLVERLQNALSVDFIHLKSVNLADAPDIPIYLYAQNENFDAIMTMDNDFINIQSMLGTPPKLIWLRVGNCSTAALSLIINHKLLQIHAFLQEKDNDILEIWT